MAGKGGYRPGSGRKPGPSKATIEKAKAAELATAEAKAAGKKLAKDVLEEFMYLFVGIAGHAQPFPPDRPQNPRWEADKGATFEKYARLAVDTAKELAKYQSPTFRAIMTAPAPETSTGTLRRRFTLQVFEHSDTQPDPKVIDAVANEESSSSSRH